MSTFILPTHTSTLAMTIADLLKGARTVASALFTAQQRQYVAQEVVRKADISERTLLKSRLSLFALARDCEEHSPNLANELRYLASRG